MVNEFINSIKNANSIAVLPHVNMDGDTLGSSLGLYLSLKKMGKEVFLLSEEEPQESFKFLPGIREIYLFNGENPDLENRVFDMVIAVDAGDIERLASRQKVFNNAKVTGNIDHHPTNNDYGTHNHVVTTAAATAEILYPFLVELGVEIDEDIATCLYTGITTDTGGYRFSNTSSGTHRKAADLIDSGARSTQVCTNVFENTSIERLKVMGEIINRLEIHGNGKISIITLPQSIVKQYNASEEDVGGFSNMGRSVRGVEVSVFIREREDGSIRVSMRAKDKVDLTVVATKYGGGGHKKAAGFTFEGTLEECRDLLLKEFLELV